MNTPSLKDPRFAQAKVTSPPDNHSNSGARHARAFTLVELLTVIVIIGILAALILPVVSRVRSHARAAKCLAQIRQWTVATHGFAADNKGLLPRTNFTPQNGEPNNLAQYKEPMWWLAPYMGAGVNWNEARQYNYASAPHFICPERDVNKGKRAKWTYGFNQSMSKKKLDSFTEPSRQVWLMDMSNDGRWLTVLVLQKKQHEDQLRWAFPRPHMGKLSIGFLDGHARRGTLSSLTWNMINRDTGGTPKTDDPIITPAQEAADEAAAAANP
ncbi:type II secretion system protein [Opitutaceae bacterium TAV4]|nr:type II secretion system protein [Opitutaceae bacterium TAV4]RRK02129.1 type II secretion system protein [Opitutaceae bacterium TAV3]